MLHLGPLELGSVPRIAVPFTDREGPEVVADAIARGADVAELRVDLFSSPNQGLQSRNLSRFRGIPTIGTIRSEREGGGWSGPEGTRLELFAALAPEVDALDVELSSRELLADAVGLAHDHGKLAIVSHHDFQATPEAKRLGEVVDAAREAGADIVKLATAVRAPADVRALTALCLARAEATPLIVLGMGPRGAATRLLLPALGSLLTFASLDPDSATAPGQLTLDETRYWLGRLFPVS